MPTSVSTVLYINQGILTPYVLLMLLFFLLSVFKFLTIRKWIPYESTCIPKRKQKKPFLLCLLILSSTSIRNHESNCTSKRFFIVFVCLFLPRNRNHKLKRVCGGKVIWKHSTKFEYLLVFSSLTWHTHMTFCMSK